MTIPFIPASPLNYQVGRNDVRLRERPLRKVTKIILHTMEGTFNGTVSWFQNPRSKTSSHYLVGQKGQLTQMVKENDTAYHATDYSYNLASIGIEHEDGGKPASIRSDALYEASARLVADLCKRYNIPCDRKNILLHREVYRFKSCPGTLDVERILRRANQILSGVSQPIAPVTPPTNQSFYPDRRNVTVTAEKGANIRVGPTTQGKNIVRVLGNKTIVSVDGFMLGESLGGNNKWWKMEGVNEYMWSGTTNIIPIVPSPTQPMVTPLPSEASIELSKETLLSKVEQLTNDINRLTREISDKDKNFQSLQSDFDKVKNRLNETEAQRLSYDTMKSANQSLVDQLAEYKTKLQQIKQSEQDILLRAFQGWNFFEIPAGGLPIAKLPLAAVKLQQILKESADENVVVGFKIGGKLIAVKNEDGVPIADLSILNS